MCIVGVVSFALFSVASLAADMTGTWKMNPAKSKLRSKVVTQAMKVEKTAANSYRFTWDRISSSGEKTQLSENRICDGKEHPSGNTAGMAYVCNSQATKHTLHARWQGHE